ncbi:LysR family transcriptional regulator [Rhizobium sp. BT-175]|uniref:LysR family transcriptional regulator n=1 Tax=Rhizobium sp. BT-175 TaxID=2986929 RepID=UPI00355693C0
MAGLTRSCFVEIRHLRYFVAVSEHGSFRKAGAALDIEPSAISRRIRDLEDRIGASLFHRHSGGVSPTVAGQRFLRYALAEASSILATALGTSVQSDARRKGTLLLAFFPRWRLAT